MWLTIALAPLSAAVPLSLDAMARPEPSGTQLAQLKTLLVVDDTLGIPHDMEASQKCPECGAVWSDGRTCENDFHQMLFWEAEHPPYGAVVHHLMVLCYHLQHPSLYSPAGLTEARRLLVDFVEHGASPAEVRQRNQASVDSSRRQWKITGTAESHGSYGHAIVWKMTAPDVVAGGVESYCHNVRAWARSINDALKAIA